MKIFCPTFSRSAFKPGLAFRIWATVTLMFFSLTSQHDGVERVART